MERLEKSIESGSSKCHCSAPEAELVDLGGRVHLQLASEGITERMRRGQIRPRPSNAMEGRSTLSPRVMALYTRLGAKPEVLDRRKSQMAL